MSARSTTSSAPAPFNERLEEFLTSAEAQGDR